MNRATYESITSFSKLYGGFYATSFAPGERYLFFFQPRRVITSETQKVEVSRKVEQCVSAKLSECGELAPLQLAEFEFALLVARNALMWSTMSYHRDVSADLATMNNAGAVLKAGSEIGLELVQFLPIGRVTKPIAGALAAVSSAGATTYANTGSLNKTIAAVTVSISNQMVQIPLGLHNKQGTADWVVVAGHQFAVGGLTGGVIETIKSGDIRDQVISAAAAMAATVKTHGPALEAAIKSGNILISASEQLVFVPEQISFDQSGNLSGLNAYGPDFSFPRDNPDAQADWIKDQLGWERLPPLNKGDKSNPFTGAIFEKAKSIAVDELTRAVSPT